MLFMRSRRPIIILIGFLIVMALIFPLLATLLGRSLIQNDRPLSKADVVVVLSTGVDYPPRLMEAARILKAGLADRVVINGNRKTEFIRKIEAQGYQAPSPWYKNSVAMLGFFGVPKDKVVIIDAPDAFDTISEADITGRQLPLNTKSIIVTTSKFHTRRANSIWRHQYGDRFDIQVAASEDDPFDPKNWWRHGRQVRQLLAEYGGWLYYLGGG